MSQLEIRTAPYDPRFPNQMQTKHCWVNYIDFHRCLAKNDGDETPCKQFKKNYRSLCPDEWISSWEDQREKGIFPANLGDGKNTGKN